jgi:hypothetical protein
MANGVTRHANLVDRRCGQVPKIQIRSIHTPAEWNAKGVFGLVKFYGMLSEQKQDEFCERFSAMFESDA